MGKLVLYSPPITKNEGKKIFEKSMRLSGWFGNMSDCTQTPNANINTRMIRQNMAKLTAIWRIMSSFGPRNLTRAYAFKLRYSQNKMSKQRMILWIFNYKDSTIKFRNENYLSHLNLPSCEITIITGNEPKNHGDIEEQQAEKVNHVQELAKVAAYFSFQKNVLTHCQLKYKRFDWIIRDTFSEL